MCVSDFKEAEWFWIQRGVSHATAICRLRSLTINISLSQLIWRHVDESNIRILGDRSPRASCARRFPPLLHDLEGPVCLEPFLQIKVILDNSNNLVVVKILQEVEFCSWYVQASSNLEESYYNCQVSMSCALKCNFQEIRLQGDGFRPRHEDVQARPCAPKHVLKKLSSTPDDLGVMPGEWMWLFQIGASEINDQEPCWSYYWKPKKLS